MKKLYWLIMALPLFSLASCIDDDSTYGSESMKIEIEDIDDIYNVVSYSGEYLAISPTVSSSFPENDMEYEWSYFQSGAMAQVGDTLRPTVITQEKALNYECRLPDGDYIFLFKARSKSTGYQVTKKTTVYAASALSKGFYVLKETEDGLTDVDLYNTDNGQLIHNVIANVQGQSLTGKPLHLDIVNNQAYLDSVKAVPAADNLLSITTTDGNIRWIRVRDCTTVKTAADCHYEPADGEMAYRSVRIDQQVFLITNSGVYCCAVGSGTGTFGAVIYNTIASEHIVSTYLNQLIYWNPQTRSLGMINGAGNTCSFLSRLTDYQQMIKYRPTYQQRNCLYIGQNAVAGSGTYGETNADQIIVVLQSLTDPNERVLYFVTTSSTMASLMSVRELQPDGHFAQAEKYAINARQATLLYCLHNNKVYSLNLNDNASEEEELTFEGLPANENITYLANKYTTAGVNRFNYLVVGTQTGSTYKLYFYETIGGKPDGAPVFTISGTGRMRNIEYTDPQLTRIIGFATQDD